jgi:hypothetical protein
LLFYFVVFFNIENKLLRKLIENEAQMNGRQKATIQIKVMRDGFKRL